MHSTEQVGMVHVTERVESADERTVAYRARDAAPVQQAGKGLSVIGLAIVICLGAVSTSRSQERWIDRWFTYEAELNEKVEAVPNMPVGPFVKLGDDSILAISADDEAVISEDGGGTWTTYPIFDDPDRFETRPPSRAMARTDDGVVVLAFFNMAERHWTWDDELQDAPGARLPNYVVRSLDGGRTWEEPVKLHDEWTGSVRDMIVTRDGKIVFTTMMMLHNPGRHVVLTYMSEDGGETWHRSNIIDLGGIGHHDGAMEATLIELQDGKLMKLIRTNWMQFWRAESKDSGRTWHLIGPSGIPASSTPAILTRLESGRLLLVWNQPYPEGQTTYPMRGGDNIWSAVPVSNHRGELSIAFSEDDGQTWSEPTIVARAPREITYPFAFEAAPGEIWITTPRGPMRARLFENDFVRPASN